MVRKKERKKKKRNEKEKNALAWLHVYGIMYHESIAILYTYLTSLYILLSALSL